MKKTIVITGAGGVLCSGFARHLAKSGARIALLDLNQEAAEAVAADIRAAGGEARAWKANVLEKENLEAVHAEVLAAFGPCDILVNGAGGNSPKCTTTHETFEPGDEARDDIATFFNLPKAGFDFVFGLNIMGVLLPTQVFARDMIAARTARSSTSPR